MKLKISTTDILNLPSNYSFNEFKKIDLILAEEILSLVKKEIKIKDLKCYVIVTLNNLESKSQFWIKTKDLI